jgi:hypothetical protein
MTSDEKGAAGPVGADFTGRPQFDGIGIASVGFESAQESVPSVSNQTGFLRAALWYAAHGFKVMPLAPGSNLPDPDLLGSGYAKTEGVAGRPFVGSADPARIVAWWSMKPGANIGLITGVVNNLLVIDCDGQRGVDAFHDWSATVDLDLSAVPFTATPGRGGGRHYLFACSTRIKSRDLLKGCGVEVKSEGMHVAAVPSVRMLTMPDTDPKSPKGSTFTSYQQYVEVGSILDRPTASDSFLTALESTAAGSGIELPNAVESSLEDVSTYLRDGFPVGARDSTCLALARSLLNKTGNYDAVRVIVHAVWDKTIQPPGDPFPWRQAEKCLRQAWDYYRAAMKSLPEWRG